MILAALLEHMAALNVVVFFAGQFVCGIWMVTTLWHRILTWDEQILALGAVLLMLAVLL